jgi:RimJ/RimL family protein N-acetyltransferase
MIVTDERVAKFIGERVNRTIYPPYTAMGIEQNGEIITGILFSCFTGNDVHMTIAGNFWPRGFLADIGHYAFDQLKCIRMTAITEQPRIVHMAERLGGKVEGLMRNQFGEGRDGYLLGFLKQDWKF